MIIKTRQCVLCKNHVAMSKVKFTLHTYSFCIGLNETNSCLAHNFVVEPELGMVLYRELFVCPFVQSHRDAILLKALGRGSSVLWTHFCSSSKVLFLRNLTLNESLSQRPRMPILGVS